MDSIYFADIAEVTRKIRTREISPREIIDAHLERIEKLQPKLNAFVHVDAEGARRQAQAAEASVLRGDAVGALHGVPISIKSCIDVAGWPCPAGSRLRADYVACDDAVLVSRLRAAGAILVGNTNVPEFLMAYETDNALSGKTSNPWELSRSAGGSSGGEAAAIASGCSMGGVGSDGGGSVRVPAHFCGISGLKPTPGRIPSTGHFPRGAGAFAWLGVVGPMARTVADVRALFDVMKGPDADDALSSAIQARSFGERELAGMRVGILESDALGDVTRETNEAVERAAVLLSEQFNVEPFPLKGLEQAIELWWFFFGPMIARLFEPMVEGREAELSPMFLEYMSVAKLENCADSGRVHERLREARYFARKNYQADARRSDFAFAGLCGAGFSAWRRKLAAGLRLSRHDAACAVVESGGFSGGFGADGIFSGRIANWCASDWQAERG